MGGGRLEKKNSLPFGVGRRGLYRDRESRGRHGEQVINGIQARLGGR